MREFVRRAARRAGYDIHRFLPGSSPDAQVKSVLDRFAVDLVIDVGANTGQYGRLLRGLGYDGAILSFEPLAEAHRELTANAARDGRWQVAPRMAIGREAGEVTINVAGNSASSSILPMLDSHREAAPEAAYQGTEQVALARLDTGAAAAAASAKAPFLKIDTQGYELAVLDGAGTILEAAVAVQVELSLTPLYDGGATFEAMMVRLQGEGLALWALWPGFSDPASGRLLQIDAIFARPERLA